MTLSLQRTLFLILTALALIAALIGTVGVISSQILHQHNSSTRLYIGDVATDGDELIASAAQNEGA